MVAISNQTLNFFTFKVEITMDSSQALGEKQMRLSMSKSFINLTLYPLATQKIHCSAAATATPRSWLERRVSGSTLGSTYLLSQNLHFNKSPRGSEYTIKFEKECSIPSELNRHIHWTHTAHHLLTLRSLSFSHRKSFLIEWGKVRFMWKIEHHGNTFLISNMGLRGPIPPTAMISDGDNAH